MMVSMLESSGSSSISVLILGASGMLGHVLLEDLSRWYSVQGTVRGEGSEWLLGGVDVEDWESVEQAILAVSPDVVINCIGVIKQDDSLADTERTMAINARFPHKLATVTADIDARLIHFSTDCVFKGDKGSPYLQTDTPDSEDLYGISKLEGEVDAPHALTIRTSIIGPELRGKRSLLEWALSQKGQSINGFQHALYTGFTTYEMARIIRMIITDFPDLHGVWQVSSDAISKYALLQLINSAFGLGMTVAENTEFHCDRRLDSLPFREATGYSPPSWETMVAELAERYTID